MSSSLGQHSVFVFVIVDIVFVFVDMYLYSHEILFFSEAHLIFSLEMPKCLFFFQRSLSNDRLHRLEATLACDKESISYCPLPEYVFP